MSLTRPRTFGLTLAVAAPYAVGLLLWGQPVTSQAVGLMTLAALMTYRMAAYRQGRFPVIGDPLEVVATVILAWAIGDFATALPILSWPDLPIVLRFDAQHSTSDDRVHRKLVVAAVLAPGGGSPALARRPRLSSAEARAQVPLLNAMVRVQQPSLRAGS